MSDMMVEYENSNLPVLAMRITSYSLPSSSCRTSDAFMSAWSYLNLYSCTKLSALKPLKFAALIAACRNYCKILDFELRMACPPRPCESPALSPGEGERERDREIYYTFSSHLRADQMCRGSFPGTHINKSCGERERFIASFPAISGLIRCVEDTF